MKLVNKFMNFILNCQNKLLLLTELWEVYRPIVMWAIFGEVILLVIFIVFKNIFFIKFFVILLGFTCYLEHLVKVNLSAIAFLKATVVYNFVFILWICITIFSEQANSSLDSMVLRYVVPIYFLFWIFMSLIMKTTISRIINEVMSGILTILFTAGTFISSLHAPNFTYDELNAMDSIPYDEILNSEMAARVLQALKYYVLMDVYKFVLPFLCISLTSLVAINVKEYWLKKNGLKEVWNDELDTEEEIVALNHRVDELVDDITILKEKNIELNSKVEEILQKEKE